VASGFWYPYLRPIYPYPTYISDYLIPPPAVLSPDYWYYCSDPPGYYPEVAGCYDPWQLIPVAPPPPLPEGLYSQADAEVRAGYRIAQDICSACHVVHPAQVRRPVLVQPGPSFEDIANRPGTTAQSLRQAISAADWDLQARPVTMPRQGLSERSTAQVAAYIMSLRQQP
jgi:mono/diheme cytochrome c family protein